MDVRSTVGIEGPPAPAGPDGFVGTTSGSPMPSLPRVTCLREAGARDGRQPVRASVGCFEHDGSGSNERSSGYRWKIRRRRDGADT